MTPRRVLILGGTVEAAHLAARLNADPGFEPITSLAGRTRSPAPLKGAIRTGGFGGAEGLAQHMASNAIDVLIDATHPFASQMSRNAADASHATGLPMLRLERPPWQRQPGDHWIHVPDVAEAARRLAGDGRRVFLSIGRLELAPFEDLRDIWFLLRMIDPPSDPLSLADFEMILGRGPFDTNAEAALLARHRIDSVVSKNSGGEATYGKIAAARRQGLPVVMVDRPSSPDTVQVETVEAAIGWLTNS